MKTWFRVTIFFLAFAVLAQNQTAKVQLTVVVVQHSAQLTWTASTTSQVTGYKVYRSAVSGSGYASIATTTAPTVTYTDTPALAGKTYYYVVTALAPSIPPGESGYSNQGTAVIPTP
jgi:fibronectin type 3 domain-containing protein